MRPRAVGVRRPYADIPARVQAWVEVLVRLPAVAYRPRVIATYDDGDWVALLLEDINGRYPDLTGHADKRDDRLATLPDRLGAGTLCHWDVRDDNLLVRSDGTIVVLDWGMACLGPWWADVFVLALAWADSPAFDDRIRTISPLPADDDVTDLLLLFGLSQAWHARQPAPPGLDNMPEFTRRESERVLAGARRRLGA